MTRTDTQHHEQFIRIAIGFVVLGTVALLAMYAFAFVGLYRAGKWALPRAYRLASAYAASRREVVSDLVARELTRRNEVRHMTAHADTLAGSMTISGPAVLPVALFAPAYERPMNMLFGYAGPVAPTPADFNRDGYEMPIAARDTETVASGRPEPPDEGSRLTTVAAPPRDTGPTFRRPSRDEDALAPG